ncbi:MAG TPA: hypothetical protein VLJ62_00540, partial [Burkholderiaceae bacterium]|nr:hypothetical protein [Burkholderiaceae bacterium]
LMQPAPVEAEPKPVLKAQDKLMAKPVQKPSRPVLPPGSLPSGNLRPVAVSAEAELIAARTAPGAFDPLPEVAVVQAAPPVPVAHANGTVSEGRANGAVAETPKIHRLVPVSAAEELDSHFGGLTTRIGRWLESLSVKRAR